MRALLIIDMLNDFIKPYGALYCGKQAENIISEIMKLKREFKEKNFPIIYICDSHEVEDEEFLLFPPHCLKGSKGAQVVEELSPEEGAFIVYKNKFSGFYHTELEKILKELKVEELYLTGVCTSICVMDTAKDAFERGFRIVIPVRAVADFDERFHLFSLERMEKIYGAKLLS